MSSFNKTLHIGAREISETAPVFVIAEAGVNHGGDISQALELIDIAAKAGADAVKFQAFRTSHLIVRDVPKAPYQSLTTQASESQTDMLRRLELQPAHYHQLKDYCAQKGIVFLITPFDEASLAELADVSVDAYKVASTDTTNLPFLAHLAQQGKPILLSTGMCYLSEVEAALAEIAPHNRDVVLLQCTADYPIRDEEANLNVLRTFKDRFDVLLGYSDHTTGLGAAPYTIGLGACVVEKHFTKDRSMEGPDHRASLSPDELTRFVEEIRRVEAFLGSDVKEPTPAERQTRKALQKALVAKVPIQRGEPFSSVNVVAKRTGGRGISPSHYRQVFAAKAERDYVVDDIIECDIE